MYKAFVRRQIRGAFAELSRGNGADLLARMSPDVHHTFPGNHALGGERSNRDAVAAWLERLFRLLPGLDFRVQAIAVDGSPLNTVVGVEWTNSGTLLEGSAYANQGAHILRLRRGKLVSFHAYLHDDAELAGALQRLAASGLEEAAAPPITTGVAQRG